MLSCARMQVILSRSRSRISNPMIICDSFYCSSAHFLVDSGVIFITGGRRGSRDLCPLDRPPAPCFQNCGYLNSAFSSHTIYAKNLYLFHSNTLTCSNYGCFYVVGKVKSHIPMKVMMMVLVSPTHHPSTLLVLFSWVMTATKKKLWLVASGPAAGSMQLALCIFEFISPVSIQFIW